VIVTLRCVAPGAIISCATETQEEYVNRQKSRAKGEAQAKATSHKNQKTSTTNDQNFLNKNSTHPGFMKK